MRRVLAFDADLWRECGYDCKKHRDNRCFYLPATVIHIYHEPVQSGGGNYHLATVKFDHHNTITRGLFYNHLLPIEHDFDRVAKA